MTANQVGQVVVAALEQGTPSVRVGTVQVTALEQGVPPIQVGRVVVQVLAPPITAAYSAAVTADSPAMYLPMQDSAAYGAAKSVFTSQTPSTQSNVATSLGNEFWINENGRITGLRYYRAATSVDSTRNLRLWDATGKQLAMATTSGESGAGWFTAMFATPVTYSWGMTVTASYDVPATNQNIAYLPGSGTITNGTMNKSTPKYTVSTSNLYPITPDGNNHMIDLIFEPGQATTAQDISGNGRNGTYVNGPLAGDTLDAAAPVGLGDHVRLDGSDDYVQLATGSWFNPTTAGFTFEGWYYVRSFQNWMRIFDLANAASVADTLLLYNVSNGNMGLCVAGGATLYFAKWAVNTWAHLVITVTNAGATLVYLNGAQVASGSLSAPTGGTRDRMWLGRSQYPTDGYTTTSLAHVAMYNTVLTPTRIAAHYAARTPPVAAGPSWSVWNGTSEVAATATVWNGTTEVATTTEIAP